MQPQQRLIRVRVADPAHISDHGEQQIVSLRHRLGDGLNNVLLRCLHQAALDLGAVGEGAGNAERGVFDIIARCAGDLHRIERKNHQQN